MGINQVTYKKGEQSTLFSTVETFSPAEKLKFKEYLEAFYNRFIQLAAQGRGLSSETIESAAKGRVWTGKMALERNLIDEIGGLDQALAFAAQESQLSNYAIEVFPPRKTFMDLLIEQLSGSTNDVRIQIPELLNEALNPTMTLQAVLKNSNVGAMLPMTLEIK